MSFVLAHLNGARQPRAVEKTVAPDQQFEIGALLVVNGNGQYAEAGADPAAVAGIAENPYGPDTTGIVRTARREFPPGMMQATAIQDHTVFSAEYVGTLPAAAGGSYGVTRGADGRWRVDFGKTGGDARVRLVNLEWTRAPINKGRVLVSFLPSTVQVI